MRTYGRVTNELGERFWQMVETDANGFNDMVYVTGLIQELKLNLGESPFWGDRGIPAKPSVVSQVAPDYYTMLMQQRYAPYFMNILIYKIPDQFDSQRRPVPTYRINITTHYGVTRSEDVPV
jgi:hypothetical protein